MMLPTHILIGLLVGSISQSFIGLNYLLLTGVIGSILPDLDMFFNHRKTFHRPFQFTIIGILALPAYFYSPWMAITSVFFLAASLHCFMDVFGNGKTMRPWKDKDGRAVYDHFRNIWITPKRFLYDGSPADLFISVLAASVLVNIFNFDYMVYGVFSSALIYSISRKRVTDYFEGYERYSEVVKSLI